MSTIVRKLRMERGWTQEQLAQLTGLSVRSIQRIEQGQSCSLETQNAIAAVFGIERSILNSEGTSTNETALRPGHLAAILYVKGLRGFFGHVYLFGAFVAAGFVIGIREPAVFWCLVGWSIGLLSHGLTAFGFLNVVSSDWERRQIEKRLEAQPPTNLVALRSFAQYGRISMKIFARLSGSAALLGGVALLAWVSYDATNVMQTLGVQTRMDEAAVASIALLLGSVLVASGIFIWRRILRPADAIAA